MIENIDLMLTNQKNDQFEEAEIRQYIFRDLVCCVTPFAPRKRYKEYMALTASSNVFNSCTKA